MKTDDQATTTIYFRRCRITERWNINIHIPVFWATISSVRPVTQYFDSAVLWIRYSEWICQRMAMNRNLCFEEARKTNNPVFGCTHLTETVYMQRMQLTPCTFIKVWFICFAESYRPKFGRARENRQILSDLCTSFIARKASSMKTLGLRVALLAICTLVLLNEFVLDKWTVNTLES